MLGGNIDDFFDTKRHEFLEISTNDYSKNQVEKNRLKLNLKKLKINKITLLIQQTQILNI
jgi:hypothetical protein